MSSGEKVVLISYLSSTLVSLCNNLYLSEKSFFNARK